MRVSAGIFSMLIGLVGYCSAEAEELRWERPTQNCDGTNVIGELRYQVHYGRTSRGAQGFPVSSAHPCEGPGLEDYDYPGPPLQLPETGDPCTVLEQGTWFVAMTAENEAGDKSKYSNELKVRLEPKEDGAGFSCHVF